MLRLTLLFPALILATYTIPQPRGPYAVSKTITVLTDTSNPDPYLSLPYRSIPISIFQAVGVNVSCIPSIVTYMPQASAEYYENELTNYTHGVPFNNTLTDTVATYCQPPSSSASPAPLILFVPSAGFVRQFYQVLLAILVAQTGYTVISLEQPGAVPIETFPDGTIEYASNTTINPVPILVQDVEFVTNELLKNSSSCSSPWFDHTKIGIFGHNQGGEVALTSMVNDSKIFGALNMDGLLEQTSLDFTSDKPFAFLAQPGYNLSTVQSWSAAWQNLQGDKWLIELEQSEHATFGDYPYLVELYSIASRVNLATIAEVVGSIPGTEAITGIATEVAAFFSYVFGTSTVQTVASTAESLGLYKVLNETLVAAQWQAWSG